MTPSQSYATVLHERLLQRQPYHRSRDGVMPSRLLVFSDS